MTDNARNGSGYRWLVPVVQTITSAGILSLIAFQLQMSHRLEKIETVLSDPSIGVVRIISAADERSRANTSMLALMQATIAQLQHDVERLDREKVTRADVLTRP